MSDPLTVLTRSAPEHSPEPAPPVTSQTRRRLRSVLLTCMVVAALAGAGYWAFLRFKQWNERNADQIPTAKVERADVSFTVVSKGELRGGSPETLIAPATGAADLHITFLAKNGQLVKAGDIVAQFDTSEQAYRMREANADVAEAEQKIIQAKAIRDAQKQEDEYALIKAENDVKLAELETRRNPLLPAITAKQNELTLDSAREHLRQVQQNLANRGMTADAALAKVEAGKAKAASQAKTAQENIRAMTLRARHPGYVSIKQNTNLNMGFLGMALPLVQVGDAVQPGMVVAEIPDLHSWEIGAIIGEEDRGHIKVGDAVSVHVIAVPGHTFHGHIKDPGGTIGNFWEHHFECKVGLEDTSPELRPGMSTDVVIATETLRNALSIPAQAVFDSNGTNFVYLRTGRSFTRNDVTLVRKNEARAVVSGLREGQVVAVSNPLEKPDGKKTDSSAMKAAQ